MKMATTSLLKHKRYRLVLLLFVFPFYLLCNNSENVIAEFLENNATKVDQKHLLDNIRFHLDTRFKKEVVFWYEGSIISSEGIQFDNLALKYNTINNALYVKYENENYRINYSGVKEFILFEKGQKRHFIKGFKENQIHTLIASYQRELTPILSSVFNYLKSYNVKVKALSAEDQGKGLGLLSFDLEVSSIEEIYEFQKFLLGVSGLSDIEITSEIPNFNETIFLEILAEGEAFKLLKRHSKKLSQTQSVSMVKQTNVNVFTRTTYFVSNKNKEVRRLRFPKKSVQQALLFLQLDLPNEIPTFRNEKQMKEWFSNL